MPSACLPSGWLESWYLLRIITLRVNPQVLSLWWTFLVDGISHHLLLGKSSTVWLHQERILKTYAWFLPDFVPHPFPLLIFLCIFFYVMNHSHGCGHMLHPMNVPNEHSNLGVFRDTDVIRTEAGVTVPWTHLIMSIVPSTTQDSEHRLRFSTGLVTQRKNWETGGLVEAGGAGKVDVPWRPETEFWKVREMLELERGGGRKNLPDGALAPGEDQPHHCSVAHSCSVVLPRKGPQPTQRWCKEGEKVRRRESSKGLTWEIPGSCPGCTTSGLLLGKWFTSFVPQFPHL